MNALAVASTQPVFLWQLSIEDQHTSSILSEAITYARWCDLTSPLPECTWKDVKDWVREVCNPGWVDVQERRGISTGKERYGWIKFRKRVDADACFDWLKENGFEKRCPLFLKYKLIVEGEGVTDIDEFPPPSQTDYYRQVSTQADRWFESHLSTSTATDSSPQFVSWEPPGTPTSQYSSYQDCSSFTPSPYGCISNHQPLVSPTFCNPTYAIGLEGQPVNTSRGSVQVHKKSIFIKGLEKSISQDSLRKKLSHDVGEVVACQMQVDRDRQPKGIAIVTFATSAKAQEAIDKFNNRRWNQRHNNVLEVRWAKEDAVANATNRNQGSNSCKSRDLGAPIIVNGSV